MIRAMILTSILALSACADVQNAADRTGRKAATSAVTETIAIHFPQVPKPLIDKYFTEATPDGSERSFAAKPVLTQMIQFNELNLLARWPMSKRFDIIFCRNVVIYFDLQTQTKLWPRMKDALAPDGILFLGHSERIADPASFGFDCTGPTTYRPRVG